jgi:hypothetical protein
MSDSILDTIDGAIEDWEHATSVDSMRWSPDPPTAWQPGDEDPDWMTAARERILAAAGLQDGDEVFRELVVSFSGEYASGGIIPALDLTPYVTGVFVQGEHVHQPINWDTIRLIVSGEAW